MGVHVPAIRSMFVGQLLGLLRWKFAGDVEASLELLDVTSCGRSNEHERGHRAAIMKILRQNICCLKVFV